MKLGWGEQKEQPLTILANYDIVVHVIAPVKQLTVWQTDLPGVEHALLPPSLPRPNPLVVGPSIFVSVFAPGALVCISRRDGRIRWRRELAALGGDSAYYAAGTVFAKTAHTLFAFAPESGEELWRYCPYGTAHEWIYSHPTVAGDRVFFGDRRGVLHCLDTGSGRVVWRTKTNRTGADVNSTPAVVGNLVIVGTNEKTVVAVNIASGRRAWKTNVDGPAVFGLLQDRKDVVVITDSILLLNPSDGRVKRYLRFHGPVQYVENFAGNLAVIIRNSSTHAATEFILADVRKGNPYSVTHKVWCPALRYVPKTGLGYLSHLQGLRLLDKRARAVADLRLGREGVGLVDVAGSVIYAVTGRGRVYALRHPAT